MILKLPLKLAMCRAVKCSSRDGMLTHSLIRVFFCFSLLPESEISHAQERRHLTVESLDLKLAE